MATHNSQTQVFNFRPNEEIEQTSYRGFKGSTVKTRDSYNNKNRPNSSTHRNLIKDNIKIIKDPELNPDLITCNQLQIIDRTNNQSTSVKMKNSDYNESSQILTRPYSTRGYKSTNKKFKLVKHKSTIISEENMTIPYNE